MKIPIDREIKLLLLKWLRQGFIDGVELNMLYHKKPLSREEIEKELDHLAKISDGRECERLKRLRLCRCE